MADKNPPKREEEDEEESAKPAPKGRSKLVTIVALVLGALLLVGASVAGTLLLVGGKDDAAAEEEEAAEEPKAEDKKAAKGKKTKKAKGKDKEKDKAKEAIAATYLPLDPPFVVNIGQADSVRFLQVSMEVMSKEAEAIEDVKKHMPAIRNSVLLLLSAQAQPTLSSPEGKEQLRTAALASIQKILKEYTGKPGVDAVYFTGFVMQ